MPRHLTIDQIQSAIGRGKSVEQFLGISDKGIVSWLELRPSSDGIELWHFEVFNNGSLDYLDLYSFDSTNEDQPERPIGYYTTIAAALDNAGSTFGADLARWVNYSLIQDEYRDLLSAQ